MTMKNNKLGDLRDKLRHGEEMSRRELESLGAWRIQCTECEIVLIKDPSSGPIWGSSRHSLMCGDIEVASWDVEGCGCYGPDGSLPNKWGMESANYFSYIPDDIQQLMDILELDDPALKIPEPDSPTVNPTPDGEWGVYWCTTSTEDSYIIARYDSRDEAKAVADEMTREFNSRYPSGPMSGPLCGYKVVQIKN